MHGLLLCYCFPTLNSFPHFFTVINTFSHLYSLCKHMHTLFVFCTLYSKFLISTNFAHSHKIVQFILFWVFSILLKHQDCFYFTTISCFCMGLQDCKFLQDSAPIYDIFYLCPFLSTLFSIICGVFFLSYTQICNSGHTFASH